MTRTGIDVSVRVIVERTPDREPAIQHWMDHERELVFAAFGEAAWPQIRAFIESVPWEPDLQSALTDGMSAKLADGRMLSASESAKDVAGRRTAAAATRSERIEAMSNNLGIRYEQMEKQLVRMEALPEVRSVEDDEQAVGTETALYRHYDVDGALLYVGVATKPAMRTEQHKARSKWFRFVVNTNVEWYNDRASAEAAERDAIQSERPIFNRTHNARNREAAVDYLFNAVARSAAIAESDLRGEATA